MAMFSRISLMACLLFYWINGYAQYVNRIPGSPYPASRTPDTLYLVDDAKISKQQQIVVQSLQGLLATYKPRIYRISDEGSLMWLSELHSRYGVYMIDSFQSDYTALVKRFRDSIRGYILCGDDGPSINAAYSLCNLYRAIVVPEKTAIDFPFLKLVLDARKWTEEDVYLKYHDSLSKSILSYQKESVSNYLGDYGVFAKAFRFYEPISN